jgi:lysine 2,3-aminomutase
MNIDPLREVTQRYDFRLTPYLQSLLRDRPPDDPLARQFLADANELRTLPYERPDPIGDLTHSPVPGVVHRHPDRVLLKVGHVCPVYCRFCFRRDMIGSHGEPLRTTDLDNAIEYIRKHPRVWEVILTGGDPLVLSSRRLNEILDRLAAIDHLGILRIHTRVPLVDPESIDDSLARIIQRRIPVFIVLHVNHPDELTDLVIAAIARLQGPGITLLSQSVLLKGINDDAAVLERLFRGLVRLNVKPYYLHHPDLAPGTAHFRVTLEIGAALMRTLRQTVSGLCLPSYVLDIPGGYGKVPVSPDHIGAWTAGGRRVKDIHGIFHHYPE